MDAENNWTFAHREPVSDEPKIIYLIVNNALYMNCNKLHKLWLLVQCQLEPYQSLTVFS